MLVKFVLTKFPKRLTSLESQYVFIQILEAAGDCFQPTPLGNLEKNGAYWSYFYVTGNFEIRNFFRLKLITFCKKSWENSNVYIMKYLSMPLGKYLVL